MSKRKRASRRTPTPHESTLLAAADEMVEASWPEMLRSMRGAISSGDLAEYISQAHADALARLLDEHEDVAKNLYRAGYGVALRSVYDSMQMAMTVVEHDCDVPGHNHGPAQATRIGRA